MSKLALAIHGGAGTILKSLMTPQLEQEYRAGLENALKVGWNILNAGGIAMDGVEATVCSLEDFHLFNAGRGSVFTHEGKNEMDASIMDGRNLRAGAVASVRNVKNPIKLARLVIERTPHILLAGDGANQFARKMEVEFADEEYFYTEHRYEQFLRARNEGLVELDHAVSEPATAAGLARSDGKTGMSDHDLKPPANAGGSDRGTVGAVACDSNGDLAAATSTGGMTNKQFGRIGDTPLIGAGTYADNATCAVSCTGHGEFFMLGVTAYDVAARMKYEGVSLEAAAQGAIDFLTQIGGEGGLIAVDARGSIVLPFNCEGMYRGHIASDGIPVIEIYRE